MGSFETARDLLDAIAHPDKVHSKRLFSAIALKVLDEETTKLAIAFGNLIPNDQLEHAEKEAVRINAAEQGSRVAGEPVVLMNVALAYIILAGAIVKLALKKTLEEKPASKET